MQEQAIERNPLEHSQRAADPRENSLRLLEFDLVREKLAGYTTIFPARELALQLEPCYEQSEVARRQGETTEAVHCLDTGLALELAKARDLREPLQRASLGGVLSGEELREVHDTLKVIHGARAAVLRQKDTPVLRSIAHNLPVLGEIERELGASIGESGDVKDSASPALRQLRADAHSAYQQVMESLERTLRRMQRRNILQEPIITQRNGRMVLLVKTEMKHLLNGIVHDVSDSGATLFVEPMAAIGIGNRWRELRLAQEREEERVVRSLSTKVEDHADELHLGLELLARLDLAMAKARYARSINATAPTIIESERQYVRLIDARHPSLEGEVVPMTVEMGDSWSLLLITGPNAGGKTVSLKTIGLLALMAQAGLHIPARECTLSLYDGVYADIGDQQSIQRSLSTFSSHVQNLEAIMKQATDRSLVLIDELGTSTDPEEGVALAKAVLRRLFQRGISVVATTHHRDVAALVHEQPGMMNASVELDPRTLSPTYRLTVGLPGRSYALTIAGRLGLEEEIIKDASSMLSPAHRRSESLLRALQEERHLAEQKRREAEEALAQAESRSAELEEQLASIDDRKSEMIEEARHQLQKRVAEIAKQLTELEKPLQQPTEQPLPRPPMKEARKEVAQVRRELRSPEWQPPPSRRGDWMKHLRAGDQVYLRGIPQPVAVITPPDDAGIVEVFLGRMRARLPAYQLDKPARANAISPRESIIYAHRAKRSADPELDLRGMRVEDALERTEGYLDDAALAGLSSVRIIHGVGTGALRDAVRQHLSHHPLVKSAGRDEPMTTDGVTLVELV